MSADGRTIVILGAARGVGKTLIARGILERVRSLGHRSIGIAPIETGCTYGDNHDLIGRDGMGLRASSSGPVPPLVTTPYRFAAAGAPAEVAAKAGIELTLDDLKAAIEAAAEFGTLVVVEGPHTATTPLVDGKHTIDLALHLNAPVLVVGRTDAPDDAAALVATCRARSIQVAGVLLNAVVPGEPPPFHADAPVFVPLPHLGAEPSIDAVKLHLASHRIVESLVEALQAPW